MRKGGLQPLKEISLTFRSLSSARFLKTIRGKTRYGPIVVKIFVKPNVNVSVNRWVRQLRGIRNLCIMSNVQRRGRN